MMANENPKPDQVTVGSVLSGCAHMGSLGLLAGKSVHGFVVKNGWELNVDIGTLLVDMYAKCGFLKNAVWVFVLMQERNVSTWTALICACKMHKQFDIADRVIGRVLRDIKPENDGGIYSLVSDLYVLNKKWDDAERVRNLVLNQNLRATAEEAPCELTVAPSGLAFFEKTVGTGPEAVKGQLIKVIMKFLPSSLPFQTSEEKQATKIVSYVHKFLWAGTVWQFL
ncbi:hypothetical protein D5086_007214 [Populus alba]|uniref:Uncharacterized protein n=1 Tax=Populus alba TaxID=43335 RepID=A0ACC4CNL3_POPAL